MELYIVQTGDTIDNIANAYGVLVDKLIADNDLVDPNHLIPGEIIIIVTPKSTYTVQEGDSLESISILNNVTVNELLRNNPIVLDMELIYPGQVLTTSYQRTQRVATHGYTNIFINRKTLKKTLPYLTYLSIFNYQTRKNGELSGSNEDMDVIQMAKEYGVVPLLLMTTLSVQGDVDLELTYDILIDEEVQKRLFDNIITAVREKGYYGVNISAQFINSSNQSLFYNYAKNLSDRLRQEGYLACITINPKLDFVNNEVTFENIDFSQFDDTVDSVLFMQYKWGISDSPPAPIISLYNLNIFLDYAISQMDVNKIFDSIPVLGYIWELPYVSGFSSSNSLTISSALNLARQVGATIEFDEVSQTPYFMYEDKSKGGTQYIVWFVNAITIDSLIKLILSKGISGTGVWNIMIYYAQIWLVINSQYEIIKLLPEE